MSNGYMPQAVTVEWGTPQKFFDELSVRFGGFGLDVCAIHENAKCEYYFDKETNGLIQSWEGYGNVYMNPPYGREITQWVDKALEESAKGVTIVALLPSRTDTGWFHKILGTENCTVEFIRGRLKYNEYKLSAPFPSILVIFHGISKV